MKEPIQPSPARRHLEDLLDEALEDSFPASDPPAMISPHDLEDTPEDPQRR